MAENFNDVTDAFDGWLQITTGVRTTGSYVNGRWVAGIPTALSFSAVIQNANPKDLEVLEEGLRLDKSIKLHTTFELIAQIEDTTTGDLIDYRGDQWLVYNVADRFIGGYHKAIAIKQ